jgi:hypothetical protein
MTVARALPYLLLLVACRDSSSGGPPIDSRPGSDAALDDAAEIDSAVDGPPSDMMMPTNVTRVWAVGDLYVDNVRVAGGFPADAQLPFSTATMAPIRVPGTGELATQTDNVFDARGTKIAFIGDATVADRFDLNVANADGSNPIVVVQGGVANVEITSVSLSPDGTKVAFTMDSAAVDGGLDLYVATTTAGATPVLVSPGRGVAVAPALDVFTQVEWSRDSKYVAFAGDLTEDGFDQVYVTDTSVATPAAVEVLTRADITATTGARGARGRVLFDAANILYFRARVAEGGQFAIYKSDVTGTKAAIALPARGDASTPDAGAFGVTPDGLKLVFSADAPTLGIYDLHVATTANLAATTKITSIVAIANATLNAQFTGAFAFSPDGLKVALAANFLSGGDNTFEPFVIALDGSATTRLAAVPANTNQDTEVVVWADNTTVFAQGDIVTSNATALYKLDATMANQTPTPAVTPPTGGDIFNLFVVRP